jgi:hypothetical protein
MSKYLYTHKDFFYLYDAMELLKAMKRDTHLLQRSIDLQWLLQCSRLKTTQIVQSQKIAHLLYILSQRLCEACDKITELQIQDIFVEIHKWRIMSYDNRFCSNILKSQFVMKLCKLKKVENTSNKLLSPENFMLYNYIVTQYIELCTFINSFKPCLFTLAGIIAEEKETIKYIYNTVKGGEMMVCNH